MSIGNISTEYHKDEDVDHIHSDLRQTNLRNEGNLNEYEEDVGREGDEEMCED